jgi:hypothetical protein
MNQRDGWPAARIFFSKKKEYRIVMEDVVLNAVYGTYFDSPFTGCLVHQVFF